MGPFANIRSIVLEAVAFARNLCRSRSALAAENLFLRKQRRARRAEQASFLGFVSNRDFRVPRLRPVGERALTGPCSVGKEATRGVQNRGQGYRGVAG